MNELRTEVAVIGAGPAGLIAAREIAAKGLNVKVFEEHPVIGVPNHCAGILSVEGFERIGVKPDREFIRHEIKGGLTFSPNGSTIRISSNRTRAYIVDREKFDRHLSEIAHDSGAEIETNHHIRRLLTKQHRVVGVNGNEEIESEIVIDAEGGLGALARQVGFPSPEEGVLSGINVSIPESNLEKKMVEVWLGEKLAPGLFAWVIPMEDGKVRCGLATNKGEAFGSLKRFIEKRFGPKEYKEPIGWPVFTGGPIKKTVSDGILLVGDVAGQCKPTTGGGVIFGGICATQAAKITVSALELGNVSENYLHRYEKSWRDLLGKEFSSMLSVRNFLNKIPDERMNKIFDSLKRANLESTLTSFIDEGDMDFQSGVLRSALSHQGLLRVLVSSFGRLAILELKDIFST